MLLRKVKISRLPEVLLTIARCIKYVAIGVLVIYFVKLAVENWQVLSPSRVWAEWFVSLWTWQTLILLFVVLMIAYGKMGAFLDAIIRFINRSRYGGGDISTNENRVVDIRSLTQKSAQMANSASQEIIFRDTRAFENYALTKLQQRRNCLVSRNVRLFNTGFVVDGAYCDGQKVYGIEVKRDCKIGSIRETVRRFKEFYHTLDSEQRKRFSAIICIGVDDNSDLTGIRSEINNSICPVEAVLMDLSMRDYDQVFGKTAL